MTFLLLSMIVVAGIVLRHRILPQSDAKTNLNSPDLSIPSGPPAQLVGGLPTQGEFTLAAVTRSGANLFAPPPFSTKHDALSSATPDSTGLWIQVNGGIGVKALPLLPGSHVWRFGGFVLKTQYTVAPVRAIIGSSVGSGEGLLGRFGGPVSIIPPNTLIRATAIPPSPMQFISLSIQNNQTRTFQYQWFLADSRTPASFDVPYRVEVTSPKAPTGTQALPDFISLTPRNLSRRFHLVVQALSSDSKPLGSGAALCVEAIGDHLLFADIPSSYSNFTKSFTLNLKDQSDPGQKAVWHIADLPMSVQKIFGQPEAITHQTFGPLIIAAAASETPDYRQPNFYGVINDTPPMIAPGQPEPQNVDNHSYTGLPSLHCLVQTNLITPKPSGLEQTWAIRIESVTPQWNAPSPPSVSFQPSSMIISSAPASSHQSSIGIPLSGQTASPPAPSFREFYVTPSSSAQTTPDTNIADMLYGIVYPGQQKFVQIQGEAIHYAYRTETLTFRDANLVYDTGQKHGQIIWNSPQAQTTPSGIAVAMLNPRPNSGISAANFPVSGSISLCLAWHLPKNMMWSGQGTNHNSHYYTDTIQCQPPTIQILPSGIAAGQNSLIQVADWGSLWLPGTPLPISEPKMLPNQPERSHPSRPQSPLYSLVHGDYEAHTLSMPGSSGPNQLHSQPLKTITVVLRIRTVQKRFPFQLIVPIHKELSHS